MISPDDFDTPDGPPLPPLPPPPPPSPTTKALAIIFGITTLICLIGWIITGVNSSQELQNAKSNIDSLRQQLDSSKDEGTSTQAKRIEMAQKWPLMIGRIELRNTTKDGVDLGNGATETFSESDVRYIHVHVAGPNESFGVRNFSGAIDLKFIRPDGSLQTATDGPQDRTTSLNVQITSDKNSWTANYSFGDADHGSFEKGTWRILLYYHGRLIGEKSFLVQ